jgi:hypothetical protein
MRAKMASDPLRDMDVLCTHCGVKMVGYLGTGNMVRYFRCESCLRWVSSTYAEVLRGDTKMRGVPKETERQRTERFKNRLDQWLAALEDQDPYRILGVSPLDPADVIRKRYRQLALESHPDRGGSSERMAQINLAYERITQHSERRRTESLGVGD